MYAIAKLSGKQFRIEPGIKIKVPKQNGNVGDKIILDQILFFNNDENVVLGSPYIKNMKIEGKISSHGKDKKIIVFKMKRRKGYRKKQGHKQEFSILKFEKIDTVSKSTTKKTTKAATTKSTTKKTTKAATTKSTAKKITKAATTKSTAKKITKAKSVAKKKD